MREIALLSLLAFCLMHMSLCQSYAPEDGGPILSLTSLDSSLQSGEVDGVSFEILNAGNISPRGSLDDAGGPLERVQAEYILNASRACDIEANLISRDGRIIIISGAQLAGDLSSKERRRVEFAVEAEKDLSVGIYPLEITLDYDRLASVELSGDPGFPDIFFQYENATVTLPVEVEVVEGPKVVIRGIEGALHPGRISEIKIYLANEGDMPVECMEIQALPQRPFSPSDSPVALGNLSQGGSASASINVYSENETEPGEYALPLKISYLTGGKTRIEEIAAVVVLERQTGLQPILPMAGLFMLIIILLILRKRRIEGKKFRGRKRLIR